MKIIINDKEVDPGSIVIAGIDPRDYPDFADAYVEYAETVNGYGLTEACLLYTSPSPRDRG